MIARLFPIPDVSRLEALLLRMLLAFALFHFLPASLNQTTQPHPVGLAHWFDLTWLSEPSRYEFYRSLFIALLFAYVSGLWLSILLPLLTLLHVLPYTLINSQGHAHHGYQILSLTLLGLSIAAICNRQRRAAVPPARGGALSTWFLPLAGILAASRLFRLWLESAWQADLAQAVSSLEPVNALRLMTLANLLVFIAMGLMLRHFLSRDPAYGSREPTARSNAWQLLAGQIMIAGCYLVSVCTKMIKSDGEWILNSHYVALDFVKTTRQSFYSNLDPALQFDPPGVKLLMENEWLARGFFSGGLFLEALLFLAIGSRRLALVFGVMLILMHRAIMELMTLTFHTNEVAAALFFINVPFLIAAAANRFRKPRMVE
jgi:hypothetical protein